MESFFNRINLLTDQEKALVASHFVPQEFPAKHILVAEHERTDTLYFIIKGCIRKYCVKDGEPWTLQIALEQEFALEFISFMSGNPSNNYLETVEECSLLTLKKSDLLKLYEQVPQLNLIMRLIYEEVLIKVHTQLNDFIMLSPEERYIKLRDNNPELLVRIPQHIVASHLGISATSLSRIRKRLSTFS